MRREIFNCDQCRIERTPANHWWIVWIEMGNLTISRWHQESAEYDDVAHICGAECLHRLLGRFIAGEEVVKEVAGATAEAGSDRADEPADADEADEADPEED